MTRFTAIALSLGFILISGRASAQFYQPPPTSPFQRSPVSPYLNLFRGGNPAVNYYGLVRPQVDTQNALQRLQQQQNLNLTLPATADASLFITGHPARFMNYSHYYYNNIGTQTPVSGLRVGAGVPYAGYASPALTGAGTPGFSFITGTGIVR
jgi:hypothetical protein